MVSLPKLLAASLGDVEACLKAAHDVYASRSWSGMSLEQRIAVLAKVPEHLGKVSESMAKYDAAESGIPITITRMIDGSLAGAFAEEALVACSDVLRPRLMKTPHGQLRHVMRPHGPALILAPWNVPSGTVLAKVIGALLAGCPVIVKPSELNASGLNLFLSAIRDAGLPTGVLQWVNGGPDIGQALVNDGRVRAVAFVGSSDVGETIAASCGRRFAPVTMECGGSNVAVVLEDADLDKAVEGVVTGITLLNGQWCAGISRVFVHEHVADELVKRIVHRLGSIKVGPSADDATEFGSLANAEQVTSMEGKLCALQNRGGDASKVHRAALPESPPCNFFPPTVVEIPGLTDVGEAVGEIFGPMASLQRFQELSDVIQVANQRPMLQSYIFGGDRAFAVGDSLHCGSVMVNGVGFGFEGVTDSNGSELEPTTAFFGRAGLGIEAGIRGACSFFAGPQNIGMNG